MKATKRLLGFVRPYWLPAIAAWVMLTGSITVDLSIPRMIQRIVDEGINAGSMSVVLTTALTMLGASLLSACLSVGVNSFSVQVSQKFAADVRGALFRKVQELSFGNLDRLQTGGLITRLTSDIRQVQTLVLMSLRVFLRAPLMMIGSVGLLLATDARLASLMLILLPLTLVFVIVFGQKARPMFTLVQSKIDKLNGVLQENLAGVRVVKAFVRDDHEAQRFEAANADVTVATTRVMTMMSVVMPMLTFLMSIGTVLVVWVGGLKAIDGGITVGALMAFVNYLASTLFPLMMLGMMLPQISASEASSGRIVQVLDSQPDVTPPARPAASAALKGRVAFEDVTFSYDGKEHEPVLQGINLVAEPGQVVAVLGATGSGKSTLVNLIPRFYDVSDGRVTIDGTDVREIATEALRAGIGVALQESVLFSGSVRDNIRYGRPQASDDEVLAAAKAAQAHDFITELPDGYDTQIGQRGVNLSGGQRQRMAIARALLVRPSVLILDDSTSAVDVETEGLIQDALKELMADRTSFIIAQRISTVLAADKIVVLEGGRVAAEGKHQELLESSPIYREIFESQLGNGGNGHV